MMCLWMTCSKLNGKKAAGHVDEMKTVSKKIEDCVDILLFRAKVFIEKMSKRHSDRIRHSKGSHTTKNNPVFVANYSLVLNLPELAECSVSVLAQILTIESPLRR